MLTYQLEKLFHRVSFPQKFKLYSFIGCQDGIGWLAERAFTFLLLSQIVPQKINLSSHKRVVIFYRTLAEFRYSLNFDWSLDHRTCLATLIHRDYFNGLRWCVYLLYTISLLFNVCHLPDFSLDPKFKVLNNGCLLFSLAFGIFGLLLNWHIPQRQCLATGNHCSENLPAHLPRLDQTWIVHIFNLAVVLIDVGIIVSVFLGDTLRERSLRNVFNVFTLNRPPHYVYTIFKVLQRVFGRTFSQSCHAIVDYFILGMCIFFILNHLNLLLLLLLQLKLYFVHSNRLLELLNLRLKLLDLFTKQCECTVLFFNFFLKISFPIFEIFSVFGRLSGNNLSLQPTLSFLIKLLVQFN